MVSQRLPRSIDELTPDWLAGALGVRCPEASVESLTIDKVIWGTATKILLDVRYRNLPKNCGIPSKLCIKGEFDERVRAALAGISMTGTQIEAVFYNDLGPQLGVPLPRHWYGASEQGMGILILDDLTASGATFGTPTKPWAPDLVQGALDILAVLHASTWHKKFPELGWLQVGSSAVREFAERVLMTERHWTDHFAKPDVFQVPAQLADRERGLNGMRALWSHDQSSPQCLIHGDAHLGNTCVTASGQPFFIDWAGVCYSRWAFDVSNFIVGALSIADRRALENDLLRYYLQQLHAHGGPHIDARDALDDYHRHSVHGMLWMTLPPSMQPLESVHAMGERYAAAMIEHDTLRLLGV